MLLLASLTRVIAYLVYRRQIPQIENLNNQNNFEKGAFSVRGNFILWDTFYWGKSSVWGNFPLGDTFRKGKLPIKRHLP